MLAPGDVAEPIETRFTFAAAEGAGIDVAEASRASFAAVEFELAARGAQFADVVRTRLLYTARDDHPVMNQAREPLFRSAFADGDFPTSGGFVTGGRGDGSPGLVLQVVSRPGKRTAFSPAVIRRWGGVQPPFVHVAEVAGIAFVSGQTAFEADGTFPPRGPGEQARKVLSTFAPILAEVGRSVSDLLAITLFVAPEAAGDAFAEVLEALEELLAMVPEPTPVVTCIGAEALVFDGAFVGAEAVAGAPGGVRTASRLEDPRVHDPDTGLDRRPFWRTSGGVRGGRREAWSRRDRGRGSRARGWRGHGRRQDRTRRPRHGVLRSTPHP